MHVFYRKSVTIKLFQNSLYSFQFAQSLKNNHFVSLLYLSRQYVFVQKGVNSIKMKDNIQFADVTEVLIHQFHEKMDSFHEK